MTSCSHTIRHVRCTARLTAEKINVSQHEVKQTGAGLQRFSATQLIMKITLQR